MDHYAALVIALLSLSLLLAFIAADGGLWTSTLIENNKFFNGTLDFGLTTYYSDGKFDQSVFPGPHDTDVTYKQAKADSSTSNDFDLELDFENLENAGRGVTGFLVTGAIINVLVVILTALIGFGKRTSLAKFFFPAFICGMVCMFLAMLVWILLGHTAALHVPMDFFAPRVGYIKLSGPKATRATGWSYQTFAAAFCFNLFAFVPAHFFAKSIKSAGGGDDFAATAQPSNGFQADDY